MTRRFLSLTVQCVLALLLALTALAQPPRIRTTQPATKPTAREAAPSGETAETLAPQLRREWAGLVYVHQKIDLRPATETLMTLDGEPSPPLVTNNVTLGLIIDNEGHIVTRLVGVTPSNPPTSLMVLTPNLNRQFPAKFLGYDAVTQLCVLQIPADVLSVPEFATEGGLPPQLGVKVFGLHPRQGQSQASVVSYNRPRIHEFTAQIVKATSDFRYSDTNPFYRLHNYQLTPIQDSSLVANRVGGIFGLAVYDVNDGASLVYPITRIQGIVEQVLQSNESIAYGWLGAVGRDLPSSIATSLTKPGAGRPPVRGVWVEGVFPESPAEQAGIRQRDVLLSINERPVETVAQMGSALRQFPPASEIQIRLRRDNEYRTVKARLVPAPAVEQTQTLSALVRRWETMKAQLKMTPTTDPDHQRLEANVTAMGSIMNGVLQPAPPEVKLRVFYGMEAQPMTEQLLKHFAAPNGLLLSSVLANGKAAQAGLQAGDVILRVGEKPVTDVSNLLASLDHAATSTELAVIRRRAALTLSLSR